MAQPRCRLGGQVPHGGTPPDEGFWRHRGSEQRDDFPEIADYDGPWSNVPHSASASSRRTAIGSESLLPPCRVRRCRCIVNPDTTKPYVSSQHWLTRERCSEPW